MDAYTYINIPGVGLKKALLTTLGENISDFGSLTDCYVTLDNGKKALMVFVYGTFHIVSGIVQFYTDLPVPVSEYIGEFWLVQENSGGLLSAFGIYKYPKGIYAPNLSEVWEQVPFSVKVSEDTITLVNVTNWTEYIDYAEDIQAGDRIVYLDIIYKNKTGNQTTTTPNIDTTNWQVSGVMSENTEECLYINGDEITEGSRRFCINPETNITTIQQLVEGIWQPTSLETAVESLWIGQRLGIAAAGHYLRTEDSNNIFHLYAHSQFDGQLSTSAAKMIRAFNYRPSNVIQPDASGNWTGTVYDFIILSDETFFVISGSLTTYNTAASEPVKMEVWKGFDNSGIKIFNQIYPPSVFVANQTIDTTFEGFIEFVKDAFYFIRFSSIANFSLKTNAAGTLPWLRIENTEFREDDMLQRPPWEPELSYTKGVDWTIQDFKIYLCNTTGIQTGTFNDNIDKWNELGDSHKGYTVYEIFKMDDFPDPIAGVITLPSGKYIIKDNISTADRFLIDTGSLVTIKTEDPKNIRITYTGDGILFTGNNAEKISLLNNNILMTSLISQVIDITGGLLIFQDSQIVFDGISSGVLGNITNGTNIFLKNLTFIGFKYGFIFDGADTLDISELFMQGQGDTFLDLITIQGVISYFVSLNKIIAITGLNEKLFKLDLGINKSIDINHCLNLGTGGFFNPLGLTEKSKYVCAFHNGSQKDSANVGSILVSGNMTDTIIVTKDTFVDLNLNASAVEASDIELWTLTNTTTGELRYDGLYPVCLNYTGLVAAYSTGGTQRFNFRLLKNGSPLNPPDDVNIPLEIRVTIGSSYLLWSIIVNPGDLFRMQVENADGTSDITIDTLKVSIK